MEVVFEAMEERVVYPQLKTFCFNAKTLGGRGRTQAA